MNKKIINIEYVEYDSINGVNTELRDLISQAEENLSKAYAPYSNFKVSAICKMANGETVCGTNQENGAYPSGLCAERVAVFAAKSTYPNQNIDKIVITTEQSAEFPVSPCGACRQVLIEYELLQDKPIELILKSGSSKIFHFNSIKDILPFAFDGSTILKKG